MNDFDLFIIIQFKFKILKCCGPKQPQIESRDVCRQPYQSRSRNGNSVVQLCEHCSDAIVRLSARIENSEGLLLMPGSTAMEQIFQHVY